MERKDLVTVIEALSPYIYVNKEALLTNVILSPIAELPEELNTVFDKALFALVWRDIEGNKAGILPHWDERRIIEITHKTSGSGNPTWYCKCVDGKTIYIRQSNKEIMTIPYPEFENMQLGDVVTGVDITIYTTTDGQFLNPEKVIPNGNFSFAGETVCDRKFRVISEGFLGIDDAFYFDIETTGVDGSAEIVSVAIVCGDFGYEKFVKPVDIHKLTLRGKNGKSASDINGITEADIENAPTFPELYEEIKGHLSNQKVVTYGDFDKRVLDQVCKRHNLPLIEFDNVDLMTIYGEYDGTPSARGGYKKHKLVDAYSAVVGNTLNNAHDALIDTQAMVEIVKVLTKKTLPF